MSRKKQSTKPSTQSSANASSLKLALDHVKSLGRGQGPSPQPENIDRDAEVRGSSARMMSVRSMRVATDYPYMFENPCSDLYIEYRWSAAFVLTCMEVDAFLGENKRGFHWRLLEARDGKACWDWALDREYDHRVMVVGRGADARVRIVKSAADPNDELRDAIRKQVEMGMRRTSFFYREANDPSFKRGGQK